LLSSFCEQILKHLHVLRCGGVVAISRLSGLFAVMIVIVRLVALQAVPYAIAIEAR
jgi:hypothetical protein